MSSHPPCAPCSTLSSTPQPPTGPTARRCWTIRSCRSAGAIVSAFMGAFDTLATSKALPDAPRGANASASTGPVMGLIERLTADVTTLKGALRTLRMTTPIAKNPTWVFPQVVLELADTYGDAPALLSDRERFTYRQLAERSNRYARWALTQGVRKGDTVCLMMPGRPEFLAAWIGITRVGGVVALVNTHLTGMALAYCINVVSPKHIVVAAELFESLQGARAHITGDAKVWLHGDANANLPRIDREVDGLPGDELAAAERPTLTIEDRALYIYTSGTTGLPKAANMNHYRVMLASYALPGVMDPRARVRLNYSRPFYNPAGGVAPPGALLSKGGWVVT